MLCTFEVSTASSWTGLVWWQMVDAFQGEPPTEYLLRISTSGPSDAPYSWQIIRQRDSTELACSTTTFATRMEALADSVRVAAAMIQANA